MSNEQQNLIGIYTEAYKAANNDEVPVVTAENGVYVVNGKTYSEQDLRQMTSVLQSWAAKNA